MLRRLVLLSLLLVQACSPSSSSGDEELTVLAASSLQGVVPDLLARFEDVYDVKATAAYGASSRLAAQVAEGAPGDVVLAADDVSLQRLSVRPEPFATTHLVIAVPPGNPGGVQAVGDLARVRVVLAAPQVPIGRYARQVLERAGVAVTPVSLEPDARAVLTKVASGEAEAALVYAVDAAGVTTIPLKPEHDVTVTYTLAVVKPTKAARAFAEFVRAGKGRDLLRAAGFGLP